MNTLKLKALIEGIENKLDGNPQPQAEWTTEQKKAALESIGQYNEYGDKIRRQHSIMEIAHTLSKIAEAAEKFTMTETQDVFDKRTVSENMKHLRKVSDEFSKLAQEAHTMQQRLESLYEDGGHILNRYFEIKDLNEGEHAPAISKI